MSPITVTPLPLCSLCLEAYFFSTFYDVHRPADGGILTLYFLDDGPLERIKGS